MRKLKFNGWNPDIYNSRLDSVRAIDNLIERKFFPVISFCYNSTKQELDIEFLQTGDKTVGNLYCWNTFLLYKFCNLDFCKEDYSRLNFAIELINSNEENNIILAAHLLRKLKPKNY